MDKEIERTASGDPVLRFGDKKPFEYAVPMDITSLQLIERHIERFIAKPVTVFHEIASDQVHIDVHVVPPSSSRPYYALITTGMSDRAMNVPPQAADRAYIELMVCLPADWPINLDSYSVVPPKNKDNWYWPLGFLRFMAHFPYSYETWLGNGHTMPNGDPPQVFSEETGFCAVILLPSLTVPKPFWKLSIRPEKTIHFLSLWPLYPEELELKLAHGSNALIDKFAQFNVSDLIDVRRPNTCRKSTK